jgi:urease accessory protein
MSLGNNSMLQKLTGGPLDRTFGEVRIGVHGNRVARWREAGAAKVRFADPQEAILINTGGGLAGGDYFTFEIAAKDNSRLAVTTQAAERVYRTLGAAAEIDVNISVQDSSTIWWVPQETILFQNSALARRLSCELSGRARLLCVESVILGRKESGEEVSSIHFRDSWRIKRDGKLAFAEELLLDAARFKSTAVLAGASAFATLLYLADDAESKLESVRRAVGEQGGASAWSGKLVARILAEDGFMLRKSLIPALHALTSGCSLPKTWSL